eukprot:TRINITY_DN6273_c0_g1_i1.p1 TRINITY_DN6273_c0_g1~~TRINITY_DN6273_c0_g1_i1.p1  ORF type:complete len:977 (-),score=186.42 TRINITY_DN6273_c0_g1_i1:708-3485(-)
MCKLSSGYEGNEYLYSAGDSFSLWGNKAIYNCEAGNFGGAANVQFFNTEANYNEFSGRKLGYPFLADTVVDISECSQGVGYPKFDNTHIVSKGYFVIGRPLCNTVLFGYFDPEFNDGQYSFIDSPVEHVPNTNAYELNNYTGFNIADEGYGRSVRLSNNAKNLVVGTSNQKIHIFQRDNARSLEFTTHTEINPNDVSSSFGEMVRIVDIGIVATYSEYTIHMYNLKGNSLINHDIDNEFGTITDLDMRNNLISVKSSNSTILIYTFRKNSEVYEMDLVTTMYGQKIHIGPSNRIFVQINNSTIEIYNYNGEDFVNHQVLDVVASFEYEHNSSLISPYIRNFQTFQNELVVIMYHNYDENSYKFSKFPIQFKEESLSCENHTDCGLYSRHCSDQYFNYRVGIYKGNILESEGKVMKCGNCFENYSPTDEMSYFDVEEVSKCLVCSPPKKIINGECKQICDTEENICQNRECNTTSIELNCLGCTSEYYHAHNETYCDDGCILSGNPCINRYCTSKLLGSDPIYECEECLPGYHPIDSNECVLKCKDHLCQDERECLPTEGKNEYTCGECPNGYVTNGSFACIDICVSGQHECVNKGCTSTSTEQGYICGVCEIGYSSIEENDKECEINCAHSSWGCTCSIGQYRSNPCSSQDTSNGLSCIALSCLGGCSGFCVFQNSIGDGENDTIIGDIDVNGNVDIGNDVNVTGNIDIKNGTLDIDGSILFVDGSISSGDTTGIVLKGSDVTVKGNVTLTGSSITIDSDSTLKIEGCLVLDGDSVIRVDISESELERLVILEAGCIVGNLNTDITVGDCQKVDEVIQTSSSLEVTITDTCAFPIWVIGLIVGIILAFAIVIAVIFTQVSSVRDKLMPHRRKSMEARRRTMREQELDHAVSKMHELDRQIRNTMDDFDKLEKEMEIIENDEESSV